MIRKSSIPHFSGGTLAVIFEDPSECPVCHKLISPDYLSAHIDNASLLSVFYHCKGCYQSFIGRFEFDNSSRDSNGYHSSCFIDAVPISFEQRIFDGKISNLSPSFSNIYNQAKQAETMKLDQIAGMGYRKSLEFLIKDYCKFLHPNDIAIIEDPKFLLGKCIETYITDANLKDTSKVTAWLGNDETHYTRVHTDEDIEDLKEYLDAAMYFILSDLIAKKARNKINQSS